MNTPGEVLLKEYYQSLTRNKKRMEVTIKRAENEVSKAVSEVDLSKILHADAIYQFCDQELNALGLAPGTDFEREALLDDQRQVYADRDRDLQGLNSTHRDDLHALTVQFESVKAEAKKEFHAACSRDFAKFTLRSASLDFSGSIGNT